MTGMAECRQIRQALGVYVLGAIDPAERAQVDEHLATCPECREELASLAGLPAMLRKVPVVEAERLAAAEEDPELTGMPSPKCSRRCSGAPPTCEGSDGGAGWPRRQPWHWWPSPAARP